MISKNLFNILSRRPPLAINNVRRLPLLQFERTFTSTPIRQMFISTEQTPNENALKFKPGKQVLPPTSSQQIYEYTNYDSTVTSPLARQLFVQCKGMVDSVMFGSDFITIRKKEDAKWAVLKPDIYGVLMDYLSSGDKPIVMEKEEMERIKKEQQSRKIDDGGQPEVVLMIRELLDTRIRPSVQEDGGDVEFMGFTNEGIVKLMLKGSCRGCSSSSITLKSGIEAMMKHYIPEVTAVEQVLDEAEELANKEFQKLEDKLNSQDNK